MLIRREEKFLVIRGIPWESWRKNGVITTPAAFYKRVRPLPREILPEKWR